MKICADETLDDLRRAEVSRVRHAHDFDNMARRVGSANAEYFYGLARQYRASAAAYRAEIARREAAQ